uniref:Uncharacterized protein n=1 Tax=Oryza sativa subsp. japonica TaxID=39947 RepID=Q5VRE6_ORYSJ|nr:hypothetical protein [Oryza sativa Japonica Group]
MACLEPEPPLPPSLEMALREPEPLRTSTSTEAVLPHNPAEGHSRVALRSWYVHDAYDTWLLNRSYTRLAETMELVVAKGSDGTVSLMARAGNGQRWWLALPRDGEPVHPVTVVDDWFDDGR